MKAIKFRILIKGKFYYWGFIEKTGSLRFEVPPSTKISKMSTDDLMNLSRQFTHAYDKKGSAIYEGAIIKEHPNGHIGLVTKEETGNFHIEWDDNDYPDWSWSEMYYDHTDRLEVIGDIDRTPELWKKNK